MKDSASYYGRNKKDCKGRAGRGRDSFLWFKTNKKRRHLAGVKTLKKVVCEGFVLADTESERWSPDTHFRRKLVSISVTPVGLCTSGRKQHQCGTDSWTLLSCCQMQSQKLLQRYIYFFFFILGSLQCCMMEKCKLRSQEQQTAFEFFWFFIRPGIFLGITECCSAWVVLESGSDWDQK